MAASRPRFKHPDSLADRLAKWAGLYRNQAETLPEGPERQAYFDKAKQCEAALQLEGWLGSKELTAPR